LGYLGENFDLIASPGWSPTDYALLALAVNAFPGRIYVQSCNYGEVPKLERFHPRVKGLPTIGCDWIDPGRFNPRATADREVDILMVANWAPFKRHWHLFGALRRMPRSLRVTMIGQPERGYTVESVREQARALGVRQDVEFIQSAPIGLVQDYQCNSKVSVILSRREGCCVAVAESLFAGSPVALLRDAYIGPRAYINDQTGTLLRHGRLDRQLSRFLERAGDYRPREWAIEHISCFRSVAKVNALLRAGARAEGRPWTTDLKVPRWQPYPEYVDPEDARELLPVYEELHRRYPDVFGMDLVERYLTVPPVRSAARLTAGAPHSAVAAGLADGEAR
jgi:glycosyltransferase involved in cell wall biosynthesis